MRWCVPGCGRSREPLFEAALRPPPVGSSVLPRVRGSRGSVCHSQRHPVRVVVLGEHAGIHRRSDRPGIFI
eukprot:1674250-Pyramimonas_sp.AAC.1